MSSVNANGDSAPENGQVHQGTDGNGTSDAQQQEPNGDGPVRTQDPGTTGSPKSPTGPQHPIHHSRHMRVICIGAGIAGLCFAYKLQRSFQDFTLKVIEKNAGPAGVWFENRYPG